MSNYRIATLLASESAATAGTKVIDVDVTDPISMLQVVFKATSAGTELAAHPAGNVTKIELVDGADVLASLSGKECQALDYYNTGRMPYNIVADISGVMAVATLNLRFGRKLWDPVLAVDPAKFRNLQLKITHNYRTADTSASAATLEVYGMLFDKKRITPSGFLMPKEHYSYTCGADGTYQYIDMPVDHLTRKYLILGNYAAYYPWQVANNIRLSEDNDKSIPFEMQTAALMKLVNQEYARAEESAFLNLNTTPRAVYVGPTYDIMVHPIAENANSATSLSRVDPRNPISIDVATSGNATAVISGFQPHGAVPLAFGDQADPSDWYDVTAFKSLKLRIKAGSAGTSGSVQVVTEQLRKY